MVFFLNKYSSSTQSYLSLYICILMFLCSSLSFCMLTLVFFNSSFQVAISTRSSSWWIRRTLQIFELGSIYIYIYLYIYFQSRYTLGNVGYFNKLLIFKSLVLLVSYCIFYYYYLVIHYGLYIYIFI